MTELSEYVNAIEELAGGRCSCGRRKYQKQTFCRICYFKLPKAMRQALYDRNRYLEAYQAAKQFLSSNQPAPTGKGHA